MPVLLNVQDNVDILVHLIARLRVELLAYILVLAHVAIIATALVQILVKRL